MNSRECRVTTTAAVLLAAFLAVSGGLETRAEEPFLPIAIGVGTWSETSEDLADPRDVRLREWWRKFQQAPPLVRGLPEGSSWNELFLQVAPSVVLLRRGDDGYGTGVVVGEQRLILTNFHVVDVGVPRTATPVSYDVYLGRKQGSSLRLAGSSPAKIVKVDRGERSGALEVRFGTERHAVPRTGPGRAATRRRMRPGGDIREQDCCGR